MNPGCAVLLAEDNEDDLFLSERILAKAGISPVFHVADGKQAMDYLAGEGAYQDRARYPLPEVVLLDLKMPEFSGHEVLEWIRSQPRFQTLKVYVLTSSGEDRDRDRASRAGALGYFVKPLTAAQVAEVFGS